MAKKQQIYVFFGTDEGACAEAVLKVFNQLNPEDADEFANDIIDGNADNAEHAFGLCSQTIQALQTFPFFGGEKIVWLKRATFLASDKTSGAERTTEGVEALLQLLENGLGDDVTFLLSATKIDKSRRLYKWLKDHAKITEINKLDTSKAGWEKQVAALVKERAAPSGLVFNQDALDLFVMLAGEDTHQIKMELEKLDLYLGTERRKISVDDIRCLTPLSRTAVIFEIGRAVQTGDARRALILLDRQLASGDSAIAILRASLIPTIRNLFLSKVLSETIKLPLHSYDAFTGAILRLPELDRAWLPVNKDGGLSVYPLFLAAKDSSKFPLSALKKAMQASLDADMALVTTALDHRMILHRLVVELISSINSDKPVKTRA